MHRSIIAYMHSTSNSKLRESEMASWIFDLDILFMIFNKLEDPQLYAAAF